MTTVHALRYAPGLASILVHLTLLECGAAYLALNPNSGVPTLVDRVDLSA